MSDFKKLAKEYWKSTVALILFAIAFGWWCLFSPWSNYTVTDEQLLEMTIKYDAENGTNFASEWEN